MIRLPVTEVRFVGREVTTGRRLYVASVVSLDEWPTTLAEPETPFVVFTALDARRFTDEQLCGFAGKVLGQGCVYACSWGADCERVHDRFDDADLERTGWSAEGPIVMTTWHENDSLDVALWFAVFTAVSPDFDAPAVLAVSDVTWVDEIEARFGDCDQWTADVLGLNDEGA